jgi:hypothetical protein
LIWSGVFLVCFALLAAAAGSSTERRSRFWLRAFLVPIPPSVAPLLLSLGEKLAVLPAGTVQTVGPGLAFVFALALMFVPALLYRASGPSPGSADDDGGGSGPEPPPASPQRPRGGIPLPDAEQAYTRLRGHDSGAAEARRSHRRDRGPRHPTPGRRRRVTR